MNQMYRQGLVIIAILLVLIGLGALSSQLAQRFPVTADTITSTTTQTITLQGEDGKTVLELLDRDHEVETQDSSYGIFVTSIDGTEQTSNAFWLYYIDGEPATEAVDKTVTKNGQTIEWRYESF